MLDLLIDGFIYGAQRLATHQEPQDWDEEEGESLHPAGAARKKNQETPSWVYPSPSWGSSDPQSTWDWELWVLTEDGAGESALPLQAGAAVTYPLCGLSRPNFEHYFHAPASAPSLRLLGMQLPVLAKTLGILGLPFHIRG